MNSPLIKLFPLIINHLWLSTTPSPNPTWPPPSIKIPLSLLLRHPLSDSLDPNLPLQFLPPESQTNPLIRAEVPSFLARAPVAVDHEPFGVELFEVDEARGDASWGQGGGGETTRFGMGYKRFRRGFCCRIWRWLRSCGEPVMELSYGRWREVGPLKSAFLKLVCLCCGWWGCGRDFYRWSVRW